MKTKNQITKSKNFKIGRNEDTQRKQSLINKEAEKFEYKK